jgi:hypothetical protein
MLGVGCRMFFISAVLAIVKVNYFTAQKFICDSFIHEVTYIGTLLDDISYNESLKGYGKIRCCSKCLDDRPHCAGVLYNGEQKKCLLLKRDMNITSNGRHVTLVDWRYFRMAGW